MGHTVITVQENGLTQEMLNDMNEQQHRVNEQLHYTLIAYTTGVARTLVRQVPRSNGLVALWQLFTKDTVLDANKAMSRLAHILRVDLPEKDFMAHFQHWESMVAQYEVEIGQQLPDGVNMDALRAAMTGRVAEHLRHNSTTLDSYAQVRSVITEYYRSQLPYTIPLVTTGAASSSSH